jgi:hypothetical protein
MNLKYDELKTVIRAGLNSAAEDFFMVGYYLRQVNDNALYVEDGYKNIWEFAKEEYGLSTSSASRFMAINARFSIGDGEQMNEKFKGMGPSKLQEMLTLSDDELNTVSVNTTVQELRAMKKVHCTDSCDVAKEKKPSADDILRIFKLWGLARSLNPEFELEPKTLKYRHRYQTYTSRFFSFDCNTRGITINGKKRLTWVGLSKALKEVFNSVLPSDEQDEESEPEAEQEPACEEECTEVVDAEQEPACEEECTEVADSESYGVFEVKVLVDTYASELKIYKENEMPWNTIQKLKILLDATTLLYDSLTSNSDI